MAVEGTPAPFQVAASCQSRSAPVVCGQPVRAVADGVGGSYSFTSSGSKIAANVAATAATACIELRAPPKKTSLV